MNNPAQTGIYSVFQWPEWKAFAARLDIDIPRHCRSMTILPAKSGE